MKELCDLHHHLCMHLNSPPEHGNLAATDAGYRHGNTQHVFTHCMCRDGRFGLRLSGEGGGGDGRPWRNGDAPTNMAPCILPWYSQLMQTGRVSKAHASLVEFLAYCGAPQPEVSVRWKELDTWKLGI